MNEYMMMIRDRKSSSTGNIIVGANSRHELHHYDAALKKKVTLLTHFQNYLVRVCLRDLNERPIHIRIWTYDRSIEGS